MIQDAGYRMLHMENQMKLFKNHKGVSLIAAIFIIVILAFLGLALITMAMSSSFNAIHELQSVQALYVAEGGTEYARYQLSSGTTCTSMTYPNVPLGVGTVTTTGSLYNPATPVTLTAALNATATTIPVSADPVVRGYAPQGGITIDSEVIWYGRIAGNSFTNVRRGASGTPAAHGVGAAVTQNQCRITSTGSVGSASRRVIADVSATPSQSTSAPTPVPAGTPTVLYTLPTGYGAGNNIVIAIVNFQNTFGADADIAAGNLRLRLNGATVLDSNKSIIRVTGPVSAPGTNYDVANIYPQQTYFFLYRHTGAPANPTYDIFVQTTATNNIIARVQMVAFTGVPNSFGAVGNNVQLTPAANGAVIATNATGLPAGANLVLAAVQLDHTTNNNNRSVDAGDLRLRKGTGTGAILNSNLYDIDYESSNNAGRGSNHLLIALDLTGGANQTYTVTGQASNANSINGAANILVLQGLPFATLATGQVNLPGALGTLGTLNTTFPSGNANIIISATQSFNTQYWNRNILSDQLVFGGGVASATNLLPIYMQGPINDDTYSTGNMLIHANPTANPTYVWQSHCDTANSIQSDTDIVAIHLNTPLSFGSGSGGFLYGWQ